MHCCSIVQSWTCSRRVLAGPPSGRCPRTSQAPSRTARPSLSRVRPRIRVAAHTCGSWRHSCLWPASVIRGCRLSVFLLLSSPPVFLSLYLCVCLYLHLLLPVVLPPGRSTLQAVTIPAHAPKAGASVCALSPPAPGVSAPTPSGALSRVAIRRWARGSAALLL